MAYVYIPAGWSKVTSGKWLFGDGAPIMNLVNGAIAADGTPAWYVWFLQNIVTPLAGLFATLVALGELAIGLGLLVGLLTGVAAFFASFVNGNFVLAGALGSNPLLVIFRDPDCIGVEERRLDRPRSLVHPLGAPTVLDGAIRRASAAGAIRDVNLTTATVSDSSTPIRGRPASA
jgi:uncharacterized membrane protein YphA (DoxX/SURF4 family)